MLIFSGVRMLPIFVMTLLLSGTGPACSEKKETMRKKSTAARMQEFVIDISRYAREIKPGFIIIPQNGPELGFVEANPDGPLATDYLNAIDAFAVEELFYNGEKSPDEYRINLLKKLRREKPVMAAEFISDDRNIPDAIRKNDSLGFITFPRSKENYHYLIIPKEIPNENADDVTDMSKVKNYLYLINNVNFSNKEDLISKVSKTNFDMITIDLFFYRKNMYTPADIEKLKTKANGGKRLVICYMNIGAAENWRYYWKLDWKLGKPDFLAKKYEGYEDEFWVKYWEPEWRDIILGNDQSYLKKILDAGFDGAYLDNTEAYYFLYKDK